MAPEEATCNLINCLQWCHSVGLIALWVLPKTCEHKKWRSMFLEPTDTTLKLKKYSEYWTSSQDNYVNAKHRGTPELCAHSPAVHTVHPWLHSQTSWELYCEVCGQHHSHQTHYKQWWEFTLGANQRTIYCSMSKPESWRKAKTHTPST